MISDAMVIFTCDRCRCEDQAELPVVFSSYSGKDPHADLRDEALEKLLPYGWVAKNKKHYCGEDCAEVE